MIKIFIVNYCVLNTFLALFIALAGLDFSAIRVPSSGNSGNGSGGLSSSLPGGISQSPISIGMNDDPAMVREAFFKNPDQLALVSSIYCFRLLSRFEIEFVYNNLLFFTAQAEQPNFGRCIVVWQFGNILVCSSTTDTGTTRTCTTTPQNDGS